MNPLGNGIGNMLPPQLMQSISQMKGMAQAFNGNPLAILQNNPQMAQIAQQFQGQNLQQVVTNICQQRGIDVNAFINELKK